MSMLDQIADTDFICTFAQAAAKKGDLMALTFESPESDVREAVEALLEDREKSLVVELPNSSFEVALDASQTFMKRVTRVIRAARPGTYGSASQAESEAFLFPSTDKNPRGFKTNRINLEQPPGKKMRKMMVVGMGPFYPEDHRRYSERAMLAVSDIDYVTELANTQMGKNLLRSVDKKNQAGRYIALVQEVWNRPFKKGDPYDSQMWEVIDFE